MTIGRQILVHISGYTLQDTMEHYFFKNKLQKDDCTR